MARTDERDDPDAEPEIGSDTVEDATDGPEPGRRSAQRRTTVMGCRRRLRRPRVGPRQGTATSMRSDGFHSSNQQS